MDRLNIDVDDCILVPLIGNDRYPPQIGLAVARVKSITATACKDRLCSWPYWLPRVWMSGGHEYAATNMRPCRRSLG